MSTDPKSSPPPRRPPRRGIASKGMLIFTYPKVIFIFPTMIAALVCGVGMSLIHDDTADPLKAGTTARATEAGQPARVERRPGSAEMTRFTSPQNLIGVLFLGVFAFNLLIMGLDFPRFTIIAIILLALFGVFFILWVGAYFNYDLMKPVRSLFGSIYAVANAGFYFTFAAILAVMFAVIYLTRYLDYWEILPNEILHHHGPLSDLERYPDDEPEVRQGDPRRPRVPLPRRGPARPPRRRTSASRSCWTTSCSSTPRRRRSRS